MVTLTSAVERALRAAETERQSVGAVVCNLAAGRDEGDVFSVLWEVALREKGAGYEAARATFGVLEAMASDAATTAVKLMALLYPRASEVFAHDICDAIDLWMAETGTTDTREFLRKLHETTKDKLLSGKCLDWMDLIRS